MENHYSKAEARAIFQKAVRDGRFMFSRHMRKRMQERKIETPDIEKLGKIGFVVNEPEVDIRTHQIKYTIESKDLKVVFATIGPNSVRGGTVMTD